MRRLSALLVLGLSLVAFTPAAVADGGRPSAPKPYVVMLRAQATDAATLTDAAEAMHRVEQLPALRGGLLLVTGCERSEDAVVGMSAHEMSAETTLGDPLATR